MIQFSLDEEEEKAAKEFANVHGELHHWFRPSATYLTYTFIPTQIGVKIVATCTCGEQKDISDYASW